MTSQEQRDAEAAEKYAFANGVAHTLRTEPAWHYSIIDFLAGVKHARAEHQETLDQIAKSQERLHREVSALDQKNITLKQKVSALAALLGE